ncbi:hypothetical protein [Methylobacterium oxalidis]|uniref:Uncharacterized protein n=1 Tax=Methylobacterium oxalidis TaxID=944322 RepID=A0A512JA97_9HYPH|nr:hypothetical protein [Methylobacterium oxalidis]GEP06853.1 hypothetical protein MOX02_48910 [Methylobacterium oxalidis]GJE35011.1 hypothetical protein LDDCCGHA_5228 [Methylobacterium oxalidis]GLS67571.1 hypothetical protein GCM10007888_59550 [Methylobacterium oxalidis]
MPAQAQHLKTFYIVQSFTKERAGLRMDPPLEARTEASARRTAERLSSRKPSVIAFARTGDPETGEFEEPRILVSYGEIAGGEEDALPF